jgi:hypothetical protein
LGYSRSCGKSFQLEEFPLGSADCKKDKRAYQNLRNLAISLEKAEWWNGVVSDGLKLQRVIAEYHIQNPEKPGGPGSKRARDKDRQFPLLQYMEERRVEQQMSDDGS